ncbi:c-type cytochrome [Amylibacter sp. SFDW26]|uniref:cytochrome c n=1 Tax=Amylibacter sp. SFDW26 TaxID=2652722 RepID=UPI0012623F10|nr:c-type cytochrome [Amylibacter sp. SFDW26]KAB7613404.1 c-type cytochrome [Amylibacter sp. SFDW26]
MRKALKGVVLLGIVAGGMGWFISAPSYLPATSIPTQSGDIANGEHVYYQSGCASCHAAPDAKGETKNVLSGGQHFRTDFGTFIAPNISPSNIHGIGDWTVYEFINALKKGVSPKGQHYYPAFPFTSYARMTTTDAVDLYAYMQTLPKSEEPNQPHQTSFPFNIRRGLGLWKQLYLNDTPVIAASNDPQIQRGQYLVEGAGHCSECHTPRNMIGGLQTDYWLAGGPNPDGDGKIPNITPHDTGIGSWSEGEIVNYLKTGFTPDFDSVGGSMVAVIDNTSRLSDQDLSAIAKYLKSIPAITTE